MKSLRKTGRGQAALAARRWAGSPWKLGVSVSTDKHAAPAFVIGLRQCGWVKIRADNPAGGAGLFDFGNQGRVGFCLDGERVGKAAGRRSLAGEGVHFGQGDFALLGGDFGEFVGFYFV